MTEDLPDRFTAIDRNGNEYSLVSILNCSPEFLSALACETPRVPCPADCADGHTHTQETVELFGYRVTAFRCYGPCPACAGRGWQYGAVLS